MNKFLKIIMNININIYKKKIMNNIFIIIPIGNRYPILELQFI